MKNNKKQELTTPIDGYWTETHNEAVREYVRTGDESLINLLFPCFARIADFWISNIAIKNKNVNMTLSQLRDEIITDIYLSIKKIDLNNAQQNYFYYFNSAGKFALLSKYCDYKSENRNLIYTETTPERFFEESYVNKYIFVPREGITQNRTKELTSLVCKELNLLRDSFCFSTYSEKNIKTKIKRPGRNTLVLLLLSKINTNKSMLLKTIRKNIKLVRIDGRD